MSLCKARTNFIKKSLIFRPNNHNRLVSCSPLSRNSTKKQNEDNSEDAPIKYSTSQAAKWRAEVSRSGNVNDAPWYQPYVVCGSLTIFMIYFFYLREESDIDLEFDKNLYDRISGLEEKQLEIVLQYNLDHNLPTDAIKNRLMEIREEKEKT